MLLNCHKTILIRTSKKRSITNRLVVWGKGPGINSLRTLLPSDPRQKQKPLIVSGSIYIFCVRGATGIRTRDTRIFSPLLYQLSYGTIDNTFCDCECKGRQKNLICKFFPRFFIKFYYLCLCNQEIPIFISDFICF